MRLLPLVALALLLAGCAGSPGRPDPRADEVRLERVAEGLVEPVYATSDPTGRLLVVEQPGRLRALEDGEARVVLDVRDRVRSGGERGFLGVAFDARGRLYLSYTDLTGASVVSRLAPADAGGAFDAATEEVLLRVEQPYANHNGGHVLLGPDGMLYVGLGDGGLGGDPHGHGQNPRTLLGSILRLDVSGETGYLVPVENPFHGTDRGAPEVWAYGLRNPWRFSFDPLTGDLWIADVGQGEMEEVNRVPPERQAGANYGWDAWEGTRRYDRGTPAPGEAVTPAHVYTHDETGGCAVTGGYVYRGAAIPFLQGSYLFGDYCLGAIWRLDPATGERSLLVASDLRISSFGEDADRELLVVDHRGAVHRLAPAAPSSA